MTENIILIPVYNDWKSLNKLLYEINKTVDNFNLTKILIVNDCSTQEIFINRVKFDRIKEIKILTLSQNLGSQKSISIGLDYLKKLNSEFYITIMDGDGEDSPLEIKQMLDEAKKKLNYVVVSSRKERNESFIIKFCYKIHLVITLMLTWHWISFGNFSCFHSNKLKNLNLNNIWYAYSSALLKDSQIKKLYATRQKRYFENSKVNFLKLIEHSLRVIGVFYGRVFVSSILFLIFIFVFLPVLNNVFYSISLIINLTILFVQAKNYLNKKVDYKNYLKNIKII